MRILITGARGQLGTDLVALARVRKLDFVALARDDLDITDRDAVEEALDDHDPDLVINAAAYTAVDRAEEERDRAFAVNRDGARNLGEACGELLIPLLHVSTDYVFDGTERRPYREDDEVAPLGVYGESKWEGEEAIRAAAKEHVIVRVSWLFGHAGNNFVKTMRRLALERDELRVVSDQQGGPTPARDLAGVLLDLVTLFEEEGTLEWGTYHYAGRPATTWHEFAQAIVEECEEKEPVTVQSVVPISTDEYPTPARRPRYSVLNCSKIETAFGVTPPSWREALPRVLEQMREADLAGETPFF